MHLQTLLILQSIFVIILISSFQADAQSNANNCTQFFRSVRRAGLNMAGRLEIPVDEAFPKFQLRLKFSRAIHHMTIRQLRARDVGSHSEFIIDPMQEQNEGMLRIDTFLRLRSIFGPSPRLNRIVYNNRAICGPPLDPSEIDGSVVVNLPTSTTTRSVVSIIIPTTKKPEKDHEEDEGEIF